MGENNGQPDRPVLLAFLIAVIFLGVNFVAVRFSNQELPPFWGASFRFIIASSLLFIIVRLRGIQLPRGAALKGAALYGLFSFALNFGFLYWALTRVTAGTASVMFAAIPLITQLIASFIGQEKLTLRGLLGALIVMAGIGVVFLEQLRFDVPFVSIAAVLLAATSAGLSGIVVRYYPRSNPMATNVVGMGLAALLLLGMSFVTGETRTLPSLPSTWLALGWLVLSSIVAFVLVVWILSRWSATATSYIGVLTPLVTVVTAWLLGGETPTITFLAGALLVLAGVYVGVLSTQRTVPARSVGADR